MLDDFSRYIIAWKLCTNMRAENVTDTLDLALILSYHRHTAPLLRNHWASDHVQASVNGAKLIALDMYKHSYHMDHGAAAARYVDAFMVDLDWEVVEARYQAAKA